MAGSCEHGTKSEVLSPSSGYGTVPGKLDKTRNTTHERPYKFVTVKNLEC
jgi:hypothetical protein